MSVLYSLLGFLFLMLYFYIVFKKASAIRNSKYWFWGWISSIMILAMSAGFFMRAIGEFQL